MHCSTTVEAKGTRPGTLKNYRNARGFGGGRNKPHRTSLNPQLQLDVHHKLIVDLFAGGGGMSSAFELAFGRSPDIAINHDRQAIAMHRANHPTTRHFRADVYEVCPIFATGGRPVGWLHLSPDCTHHSQAAGGQPRSKKIRGLSWVGYRWAGQVHPDVISLENVGQILKWGPLVAKRDKATGRVVTLDMVKCPRSGKMTNRIADPGEQVPVTNQYLVPDPKRAGQTWKKFVRALEGLGYQVEWKTIRSCDQGAHTTRERLYMLARRDGQPIVWPEQTHFKPKEGTPPPMRWKPAADCIDFSDLGKSIFGRPKDLAEATQRRIAAGISKFVLRNPNPFIVPIAHYNGASGGDGVHPAAAYMMQANGGFNQTSGHDLRSPMTTVTNSGSQQQLVTAFLTTFRTGAIGSDLADPIKTITAGGHPKRDSTGNVFGLIECQLSQEDEQGALRVAAFLMRYHSTGGQWANLNEPLTTVTTRDRLALVTVWISGEPWVIVDIRLRMLTPRELYRAQDFPDNYIIEYGIDEDGQRIELSKSAQIRMCGNSVNPVPAAAFLRCNAPELAVLRVA